MYPPYIDAKLPAQTGSPLKIPFQHNRANSGTDFTIKIKNISTNEIIGDVLSGEVDDNNPQFIIASVGDDTELTVGQFYKLQVAYSDSAYYSSVGIFKYTNDPDLGITIAGNELTGTYSNDDKTETIYSYCFYITTSKGEEVFNSGELIHNSLNNAPDKIVHPICTSGDYQAYYRVITVNGLVKTSAAVELKIDPPKGSLNKDSILINNDLGYIKIVGVSGDTIIRSIATGGEGKKSSGILKMKADGDFIDNTCEQGIKYIYDSINSKGERRPSSAVVCYFEDSFLSDKEKTLRLKFNTKISSIKNTLLESKMDTIGSQHPFIFRNGKVKYKEFPINSLLTYWTKDEEIAESKRKSTSDTNTESIPAFPTTNLTNENYCEERKYKLEILEWLNNGKPKLFRSPSEGNYIVRLLNVSLTPQDQLGRMIHSFTATAYEIAEYTPENLEKYGLI